MLLALRISLRGVKPFSATRRRRVLAKTLVQNLSITWPPDDAPAMRSIGHVVLGMTAGLGGVLLTKLWG
jgi:hypothetical protein